MKKQMIIFMWVVILFISLLSTLTAQVSSIDNSINDVVVSNVTPGVVPVIVQDGRANFKIIGDTIDKIKDGQWGYVTANFIALLALLVGLSRWITKALVLILTLLMKITPDNVDAKIQKVVNALITILAWITNAFGWLSLSKMKGSEAVKTEK
mgnify:CR=1 FL=1